MKEVRPLIWITVVFVLSRIVFYIAGVRYDVTPLETGIQLADPSLLTTRLWETLYHLHSQPPLFNLYVGAVLKLFPQNYVVVFHLFSVAVGYAMAVGFYRLLRCFRIAPVAAVVLVGYFILNPATILLENWLLYTYFNLMMLCWLAVFVFRFAQERRFRDILTVMGMMAVLVWTKSTFHLLWFGVIWSGALIVLRTERRKIVLAGIVPFLAVAALYGKNYMVFQSFTTSKTWMAHNLMEMNVKAFTPEETRALFVSGRIRAHPRTISERTGIPVLDQMTKPGSGEKNWHSLYALRIADIEWDNARYLMKHHPQAYRDSLIRAYMMYFFPGPTDISFPNRQPIAGYENLYNVLFAPLNALNGDELYTKKLLLWYEFDAMKWDALSMYLYAAVIFFYVGSLCFGIIFALWHGYHHPKDRAVMVTLLFMAFNILYITTGSNLFAWIGANRYRFVLEPYYLTMFAVAVAAFVRRRKRLATETEAA